MSNFTAVPASPGPGNHPVARLRMTARQLDLKFWSLFGGLTLAALAGIASTFAWMSASANETPVVIPDMPTATAYATSIATSYLTGTPTSLPVGSGIGPTLSTDPSATVPAASFGAEGLTWVGFDTETTFGHDLEIHQFRFGPRDEPLGLAMTIELTSTGPVLAAPPSVLPVGATARPRMDYLDVELATQTAPQPIVDQLNAWARAYMAGDQQTLRALSGRDVEFTTLSGFTVNEVRVVSSLIANDNSRAVAQVVINATHTSGATSEVAYDVSFTNPSTGLPLVRAWGPPGTGLSLTNSTNQA